MKTFIGLVIGLFLVLGFTAAIQAQSSSQPGELIAVHEMHVLPVVKTRCEDPKGYKDCSGHCDDLSGCKKCCGRARLSDSYFDKCIDRCNKVFSLVYPGEPLTPGEPVTRG